MYIKAEADCHAVTAAAEARMIALVLEKRCRAVTIAQAAAAPAVITAGSAYSDH
jgi:hypothetical protein